ncbi:hybrid sensor histidine kinase/response regulator transcription factor [Chitinophaga sp. Ak27]|uniref:hybrid sensor histidine kinase/response regulator transcription factor n=1 Tax=Chitinophaga sp. Ak27 TaxID=2726116 RepID=UPI00145C91C2|nr:hybrid sensor histidine kinase/response regulator transcription factor [Chitinophaga sp. Ak27]NLU95362.1 response regulator [Chitinophaga sp. Ak27]
MRYLLGLVLLLSSLIASSQSIRFNFSKLNTYNGLSHNEVKAILKDQDGFMWFGTTYGLNRYDGYSCKIFRKDHNDSTSLKGNNVISLYELPGRKMWVSTMGGACIYNADTEKFDGDQDRYLSSLGLPAGSISNIVKGKDGRYWFLYVDKGLYLYSANDKSVKPFNPPGTSLPAEKITAVKETTDGKIWLVYQSGFLQEYDIKSGKAVFSSTALQQLHKGEQSFNIFIDSDGDVWCWAYNNGLFFLHAGDSNFLLIGRNSFPAKLNSELVSQVAQDDNGLIWVGTDHGGITLIDKKRHFSTSYLLNNPNDPKSISQNSITTIYKDNQGIIWLGTYKQGINYYNSGIIQFPYYHHRESDPKSLQFDDVNRFVEDRLGNIWIGTNGGGLIYFDRKNNSFKQYLHDPNNNNSLSNNVIVSLWVDRGNILWVGTYLGGLNSFDGRKFTHYRHQANDSSSLADDTVWEIFEDREQQLWIGTLGGGLDRFDRTANRFMHYKSSGGANYITTIIQDKKGDLWIGSSGGITVFEKDKSVTTYQHTGKKNSLSDDGIFCLLEDTKGRIWVGTREGLNLFNKQTGEFQTFTTSDGLPDNMILDILEDAHQTFWISTPSGLCNAIPRQNNSHITFSVINYDVTNNLQDREFNDNAALRTRSGELIFGGPSGFNIINPTAIKQPVGRSKVAFTGFQILDRNIEPGEQVNNRVLLERALSQLQSINLKYKENVFSIDFASLDFSHNRNDKYAYMLEGFNTDWLYTGDDQRRATYTNLSPGHYTFKVKVLDRTGAWSEVKTLQVNIQPPFWRTPIAWFIYLLIAGGLFLLIRRITLERIHMRFEVKQQRREAERAHALEQLKTKFFTNVSHEFRTPLSLIIAPLDKIIKYATDQEQVEQLNLVQRNAKRLLNLVNQLLDFRKMEVQEVRLHPAVGDIVSFCRETSLSFTDIAEKKKIQFSFASDIDCLEIYFDKDKIEKILFNLLSNAFKYTYDHGKVSVNLTYNMPAANDTEGTFAISIKDSGIGIPAQQHEKIFERFFQTEVPESMVNQGTGIGLAITKEFVKLHNGTITVESEPNQGTCFTVLLPARRMYVSPQPIAPVAPAEEGEQIMIEEEKKGNKKKTIMIVEDNEDLRFYLKDNLKDQYHVEEATNGSEGWEKIKRLNPDLVVSDVMMPIMDGVALAGKIKSEMLTAHIPVILLTAMGSEEKQLEGLKAGANDYITKPFTFEILASRINNLLVQQQLLKKRFQKQITVNPEEVTITPVDEKFLKQALEIIENQMDNPDFSVDEFSRKLFMSRVTLYRKINSLTGKSPLDFIRSIRLKRAAQLLNNSGMSIAEVAYQVGFNNPKVFSKLFKEEFRVTPSEYAASLKNKTLE